MVDPNEWLKLATRFQQGYRYITIVLIKHSIRSFGDICITLCKKTVDGDGILLGQGINIWVQIHHGFPLPRAPGDRKVNAVNPTYRFEDPQ